MYEALLLWVLAAEEFHYVIARQDEDVEEFVQLLYALRFQHIQFGIAEHVKIVLFYDMVLHDSPKFTQRAFFIVRYMLAGNQRFPSGTVVGCQSQTAAFQ